ncbi:unnamed protein product [Hydatigera taeniaeformis]|uniref:Dynein light chain n=1 Tax=Hydatigena taeniaeformis TaxID=6205 RepID=A0A0R3WY96_HYDTA|nr:unnamed protein product [Hydatigera taeniaeformis]
MTANLSIMAASPGPGKPFPLTRKANNPGFGQQSSRAPNTFQLAPVKGYAFATHCGEIRNIIRSTLDEALVDSQSDLQQTLMDALGKIKSELLQIQALFFPRHRLVVHGIIGGVVHNQPSIIYGSQCLGEHECGDDGVSVSVRSHDKFICVSAYGFYQS